MLPKLMRVTPWLFWHSTQRVLIELTRLVKVLCGSDRLIGLVVKASTSRAEGHGFESRLRRDFFGVESYQ